MKMITHWGSALILGLASLTAQATVQVLEIDSVTVDREKDRIYIEGSWFKPVTSPGTPIVRLGGQDLTVQSATGTLIQARLPRKLEDGEYTLFVGQATGGTLGALEVETTSATYSLTLNSGCTVSACQYVDGGGVAQMQCGETALELVCNPPIKRVFVSESFGQQGFVDLAVADAHCQANADAAGLPGDYLAWISNDFASPDTRFTKSDDPYVLPSGVVIANSWAELTDGGLDNPIGEHADGRTLDNEFFTMGTGTNADGRSSGFNCENWTVRPDTATGDELFSFGQSSRADFRWTRQAETDCRSTTVEALYCFQQ